MSNVHALVINPSRELGASFGDIESSCIISGGIPVASGTTTVGTHATIGYIEHTDGSMIYVSQVSSTIGPLSDGDGTYWLALHTDLYSTVGSWTRQSGTHYLWIKSATRPATPTNGVIYGRVVVAAGAASTVADTTRRRLVTGTLTCAASITIDADATWEIRGGTVAVNNGVTVTCNASIIAGDTQWITLTGTGAIRLTRAEAVPQWWGAKADAATDDFTPVQACFASEAPRIRIPPGTYMISAILSTRNNQVYFFQPGATFLATVGGFAGVNDPMLSLSGRSNVTIYGYGATFTMRRDSYTSGEGRHAILLDGTTNACIEGLTLTETGGDGISVTGFITPSVNIVLRDLTIIGASRNGISVINVSDCLIENCTISNTFKGAAGSAPSGPWAGIDIEPDVSTHLIRNIRIKNLFTTGNASSGIQTALYAMDQTSSPVDVLVDSWHSQNDGSYTGNTSGDRCGARITSSSTTATAVPGVVRITNSTIVAPHRQGVKININYTTSCSMIFENVRVVNPNEGAEAGNEYRSGFTFVVAGTESALPLGNIRLKDCSATDDRGTPRMIAGVYLYSADATRPIQNVVVEDFSYRGQVTSGGPVIARGGYVSFEARYRTPPRFAPSGSFSLLQDYFGALVEPSVSCVLTIPPRGDWGNNRLFVGNPGGNTIQVRPNAADTIFWYGRTAGNDIVLDGADSTVQLRASSTGIVVETLGGRSRPLGFSTPASVLFAGAAPVAGTWARGDIVWNITAASGAPPFWMCTVAGTPGTWVAAANLP